MTVTRQRTVATRQMLASQAGARILARCGSAAEAAIASARRLSGESSIGMV